MAKKSNKAKKSTKKTVKKTVNNVKNKIKKPAKKKSPVKTKKKSIVKMSEANAKLFITHLQSLFNGSLRSSAFDKFLLEIYQPASIGKEIENSNFTITITHSNTMQAKNVGIDINRIELKDK